MSDNTLSLTPEHQAALQRYDALIALIPTLEAEKEGLLNHTIPMLNAHYLKVVGEAKLTLLELQLEAFVVRRKVEMARASIQRGSPVLIEVIEALVEAEAKERKEKIEAEARRLQDALRFTTIQPLSDEDSELFKKTYYALAKSLHPDLNPDAVEVNRVLWDQVQEAHARGDLHRLLYLRDVVESRQPMVDQELRSSLVRLQERCHRLQETVQRLESEIAKIHQAFPCSHSDKLYDDAWIAEQNSTVRTAMVSVMEEIRVYQEFLKSLTEGGSHE